MYRIVVGDETLWTPTLENNNYLITDPTLTLETNKPATLNFTVPNISVKQDLIKMIRPEIKVYDNDRRIFRGRVLTNGKDFKRNRSIYCEGELSYLRDVIVRPDWTLGEKTVAAYFSSMIAHYNEIMDGEDGVSDYKKFVYGGCDVTFDDDPIERKNDQYPDMLSELTDKLLNKYGGYFVITVGVNETTYISYLQDPGEDDSVTIQYGKNLLDLNENTDATPVYTRIIPLGGQENNERVTIDDLYITTSDTTKLDDYGLIEHVETYDEIKTKPELEAAGRKALNEVAVSDSLEITALNSRMPDGSYGVLTCGKTYRILSAPHGYVDDEDDRGRLNRQELKLAKPLESRYTFGRVKTGITQEAVSTNRAVDQVTKLAQMTSADVTQLKKDVETLKTSYVVSTGLVLGFWVYRQWNTGLWEYFTYGASVTWSWTEVSTGRWHGSSEISLPQTMVAYTVIVTPSGLVPLTISAQQQTDRIILYAETTNATQPATSNVNIVVYYLDLS